MGLATDWAHGVFYRPVHPADDGAGYGGTRYMPLYFVLHGTMIRLGLGVVTAGMCISAVAGAGLLAGVYRLRARSRRARALAFSAAALLLGSGAVQSAFTTTKADLLAASLNVWGVALCLRWQQGRAGGSPAAAQWAAVGATLCFILAFSAKLTTVCGAAACASWLLGSGQRRGDGVRFAAWTGGGAALVAACIALASAGRMPAAFLACAAGGAGWRFAAAAPWRIIELMLNADRAAAVMLLVVGLTIVLRLLRPASSKKPFVVPRLSRIVSATERK